MAITTIVCLAISPAFAQGIKSYPSKLIRFVVPFTAGGSNDVLARTIGQKVSADLGQAVVVENKPGAGGNLGAIEVARNAGDGYVFLVVANNFVINPNLYRNGAAGYDPFKDFVPVAQLGTVPILLVVNSAVPANNVKGLVALAKSKPGGMSYASAGVGTPHHLTGELFKSMAGVDMTHVPYRGASPAVADLISGQI